MINCLSYRQDWKGFYHGKNSLIISTCCSFEKEKNSRLFTIFPELTSTFPGLENCDANFKTFSRIQNSVQNLTRQSLNIIDKCIYLIHNVVQELKYCHWFCGIIINSTRWSCSRGKSDDVWLIIWIFFKVHFLLVVELDICQLPFQLMISQSSRCLTKLSNLPPEVFQAEKLIGKIVLLTWLCISTELTAFILRSI